MSARADESHSAERRRRSLRLVDRDNLVLEVSIELRQRLSGISEDSESGLDRAVEQRLMVKIGRWLHEALCAPPIGLRREPKEPAGGIEW